VTELTGVWFQVEQEQDIVQGWDVISASDRGQYIPPN